MMPDREYVEMCRDPRIQNGNTFLMPGEYYFTHYLVEGEEITPIFILAHDCIDFNRVECETWLLIPRVDYWFKKFEFGEDKLKVQSYLKKGKPFVWVDWKDKGFASDEEEKALCQAWMFGEYGVLWNKNELVWRESR